MKFRIIETLLCQSTGVVLERLWLPGDAWTFDTEQEARAAAAACASKTGNLGFHYEVAPTSPAD